MIPATFEMMAERAKARRVVDLHCALLKERGAEPFAFPFSVTPTDPEWSRVLVLLPEEDRTQIARIDFGRYATSGGIRWFVRGWIAERGVFGGGQVEEEYDEAQLFQIWGLP